MAEFLKNQTGFNPLFEDNQNNLIWVDVLVSGTPEIDAVYESRKVKQSDLLNLSKTFTRNNNQDLDGYSFSMINGKRIAFVAGVAPTIGQAFHSIQGYGTSGSDILHEVKNGAGAVAMSIFGNKNIEITSGIFDQKTTEYNLYHRLTSTGQHFFEFNVPGFQTSMYMGASGLFQITSSADINLISTSGRYNISSLPTSDAGLLTGGVFTQTATQLGGSGTTKVLCIK